MLTKISDLWWGIHNNILHVLIFFVVAYAVFGVVAGVIATLLFEVFGNKAMAGLAVGPTVGLVISPWRICTAKGGVSFFLGATVGWALVMLTL